MQATAQPPIPTLIRQARTIQGGPCVFRRKPRSQPKHVALADVVKRRRPTMLPVDRPARSIPILVRVGLMGARPMQVMLIARVPGIANGLTNSKLNPLAISSVEKTNARHSPMNLVEKAAASRL